jgi:two-component system phosphate regulon sensor histidine kinase PhoR
LKGYYGLCFSQLTHKGKQVNTKKGDKKIDSCAEISANFADMAMTSPQKTEGGLSSLLSPGSANVHDLIIKNLPLGFLMIDEEGTLVEFNGVAEAITGYTRQEVLGKSYCQTLHGSSSPQDCTLVKYALRDYHKRVEVETSMEIKGGEHLKVAATVFPLTDDSGKVLGAVELFRDITARKKLERERKNILSMFAHDMKNPALVSVGFIGRILAKKAGKLTKKQQSYLEIVSDNLSGILNMINNFLEFARVETKEYDPRIAAYDIVAAIKRNTEVIALEAAKKNIQIFFDQSGQCPSPILADPTMIDRVIVNLLSNALKFSKPYGTITVQLKEQGNTVTVRVTDTGIGIHKDQLHCIFDPFYRVSSDSKGSGLGLAIAKTIIEAHDGSIGVESVLGQGSTFSFTLPRKKCGEKCG